MVLKCIGLMSGTSMDGVDAALMHTDGQNIIEVIANSSLSYDTNFKKLLRKAEEDTRNARKNMASFEIIKESTEIHAKPVNELITKIGINYQEVDLIGYHGQSLYHNPDANITVQIGNGQALADMTKIPVINDFRSQDIQNGGQGAPLAPIYHQALAKKINIFPIAFINCGGIANVSLINGPEEDQVTGFDTGPGNALIDLYVRQKTDNKEFMDLDGRYGKKGKVNYNILQKLMDQLLKYINTPPPKSLDPGNFSLIDDLYELNINDGCATLEAFTALSIASSFKNLPKKLVLAGGGWNNPMILNFLKEYLSKKLSHFELNLATELGFSTTYMEAELFAYLAARSYYNLPISFPKVTGCRKPTTGGTLYKPKTQ